MVEERDAVSNEMENNILTNKCKQLHTMQEITTDEVKTGSSDFNDFNDFSKFFLMRQTDGQEGRYILRLVPTRGGCS